MALSASLRSFSLFEDFWNAGRNIDARAALAFPSIRESRSWCSCRRSYRSEEHTSELQSRGHLVCRLLLEKKKTVSEYGEGNDNNKKARTYYSDNTATFHFTFS